MIGGQAGDDGFTIVELLVSLTITAAAAGLLTATLATARTARDRGEAAAAVSDGVAAAQALVRGRIERLVEDGKPVAGSRAADPDGTTVGAPTVLSFLAPPLAARPPAGPLRYTLALASNGAVVFTIADREGGRIGARLPVIDGARALDLAYLGTMPDDPVARWRPRWSGRVDPPELVRVRVRFAAGDRRVWPDLVVAPAANVNAACQVDPNSGRCG